MKLLMAYNFTTEEDGVDAPNFYRACAERIFPEFGVKTTFLPNLRITLLFRFLVFTGFKDATAMAIAVAWWLFRNGHKFEVIVGWLENGLIAAILRFLLPWPRTHVCLILYRLTEEKGRGSIQAIKRRVINAASRGAELLLALDTSQAESFAKALGRKPGATRPLTYGVDAEWYDNRFHHIPRHTIPMSVFCPGGAYRDDTTLERAVGDLNVQVKRFQLDGSRVHTVSSKKFGLAHMEYNLNAPYAHYIAECYSAAVIVISVANSDKPVGLTSLLECMALGCAVIITKGTSTHDYVRDGVTALLYEEGNWQELREKIMYLLEHPDIARQIGIAARESVNTEFGLEMCGQRFFMYLDELGMWNA